MLSDITPYRPITANASAVPVTLATNGREVLDLLESRHFDVVLMDVQIPKCPAWRPRALFVREKTAGGHQVIIATTAAAIHALAPARELAKKEERAHHEGSAPVPSTL